MLLGISNGSVVLCHKIKEQINKDECIHVINIQIERVTKTILNSVDWENKMGRCKTKAHTKNRRHQITENSLLAKTERLYFMFANCWAIQL